MLLKTSTPDFKSVTEAVPSANPVPELAPPIRDHVKAINALSAKLERAEAKVEQYQIAIGQHIKAIKLASPDDWKNIVKAECDLGHSRAYELMAIADGTKTVEQVRADNAGRKREERKRQSVTSRTENNAGDPEASAEAMKERPSAPKTAPQSDDTAEAVRSGTDDSETRGGTEGGDFEHHDDAGGDHGSDHQRAGDRDHHDHGSDRGAAAAITPFSSCLLCWGRGKPHYPPAAARPCPCIELRRTGLRGQALRDALLKIETTGPMSVADAASTCNAATAVAQTDGSIEPITSDLAGQLQAAKVRIAELEGENAALKAELAALRVKLAEAPTEVEDAPVGELNPKVEDEPAKTEDEPTDSITTVDTAADDDGLDVPQFLVDAARRRWPKPSEKLTAPSPHQPPFNSERLAEIDAEIRELQCVATQRHLEPRELRRLEHLHEKHNLLQKPESLAAYLDRQAAL
jgi:hypothetical protein